VQGNHLRLYAGSWSSFLLGYLCGLMTLPGFTMLCLITIAEDLEAGAIEVRHPELMLQRRG
jgi:hypothetical protein